MVLGPGLTCRAVRGFSPLPFLQGERETRHGVGGRLTAGGKGLVVGIAMLLLAITEARAQTCGRPEFETVVQEAASVLTALNNQNKPSMHDKLRKLRDKRGWSSEQFLKEAEPFVRDAKIEAYDKRSEELLGKISSLGATGEAADCKLLGELRQSMQALVKTQQDKWAYLFGKLDEAIGQ